jgi:hypothetical protein
VDNKKAFSEAGRWLRVSALTISTLGPIVGTLLTRIREQQLLDNTSAAKAISETTQVQPVTLVETEEKPSLSASLALLRERAYNQDLLRRADELTEELRQRSRRLSQSLAERGSDISQELSKRGSDFTQEISKRSSDLSHEFGKRGSDLSHELGKRSSDLSHELGKQSKKVGKNLKKQTRQVSHNLSEQDSTLWIISGFAVGLLAASTAAFILIRSRLKQQQGQDEDEHILLSQNGHLNIHNGNNAQPATNAAPSSLSASSIPNTTTTKPTATIVSTPPAELTSTASVPVDAAFLGLSSTKRYYPAQTPLDQLSAKTDQPLDIVYFSSEEEAEAQGFTAAEK